MRAVVHWFRSVIVLGGLCALPCGQAAPSLAAGGNSSARPALALGSLGGTAAAVAATSTTVTHGVNFVEASRPVTLGSLRRGTGDLAAAPAMPARTEAMMPAGFGSAKLQLGEPPARSLTAPDANTTLALMLAALGVAALAAARAPVPGTRGADPEPSEPARH